eukprot:6465816-Amphidinium_carterae.2
MRCNRTGAKREAHMRVLDGVFSTAPHRPQLGVDYMLSSNCCALVFHPRLLATLLVLSPADFSPADVSVDCDSLKVLAACQHLG